MGKARVELELTPEEANFLVEALAAMRAQALADGNSANLTADVKDADRRWRMADTLLGVLTYGK